MYSILIKKTSKKILKLTAVQRRLIIICLKRSKTAKPERSVVKVHVQRRLISPGTPMYCFQCEQTSHNLGCTSQGICGKTAAVSNVQDLLLHVNNGVAQYVHKMGEDKLEAALKEHVRENTLTSYFSTLTNVNFSEDALYQYIENTIGVRDQVQKQFRQIFSELQDFERDETTPAAYRITNQNEAVEDAMRVASLHTTESRMHDKSCFGLRETAVYGLKGVVAYFDHAESIRRSASHVYSEQERDEIYSGLYSDMAALCELDQPLDYYLNLGLKIGASNVKVLELLDRAHNGAFGTPEVRSVSRTPVPGKCILLSGHDILDVRNLLQDIDDSGLDIGVYTHGELLPAHSYPGLNKFPQLKGHFGDAWQQQIHNFKDFPGPIVLTSNCLMPPRRKYRDRLYTSHAVGYDDIKHVDLRSKSARSSLLRHALEMPGFEQQVIDVKRWSSQKPFLVGFGHATLMQHAGTLLEAINNGELKHIFYIGGCDGTEHVRSYFGDLASITPGDSLILTSGCGKFRLKDLELGTLGSTGIPRILDIGQCNDAYSAVVVATKLADALGCSIHDLPLHFAVSWFEQKAVAIFLSLLHLGIKNVRLGPALPAFLTPEVKQYLTDNLGVRQVNSKDEAADMKEFLQEV